MKQFTLIIMSFSLWSHFAVAADDEASLRALIAEQKRTIQALEKEIDSLHTLLPKKTAQPPSTEKKPTATEAPAAIKTLAVVQKEAQPKSDETQLYTIKKGDTLSKIARRHKITLGALLKANKGFNPNHLRVGQKIKLPVSAIAKEVEPALATTPKVLPDPIPPATATEKEPQTEAATSLQYTVKRGDTLYSIARRHNTTVAKLLTINKALKPSQIRVGQKITISHSAPTPKTKPVAKTTPVAPKTPAPKKSPSKAPTPPQKTEPKQPSQQIAQTPKQPKVRTVKVTRQITFGEFAATHGASVEQINEMNGLSLTKSTVLAQGSELYIPND